MSGETPPPRLEPKEITIQTQSGKPRTYVIYKFPAVAGREIISKTIAASIPDLEKYNISEETMLKLMSYVAVQNNGSPLLLTTQALIDNHVPDWETLDKLEKEVLQYNCSFFLNDKPLTFFDVCLKIVEQKATEISTILLRPLSTMEKQLSTN